VTTKQNPLAVEAEPTKEFFISMLVRDIQLIPAIVDLVDNSVDGAIRLLGVNADLNGVVVRLTVTEDEFKITDNCGGIPLDIAKNYAFRFGRAVEMAATPHSIGQFGVGMKRALFKLGREFEVRSSTVADGFVLKVNVEDWRKEKDWHFAFSSISEVGVSAADAGTSIEVGDLHEAVARDFARQQFLNDLTEEIANRHQSAIDRGLVVSLNGVPINVDPAMLLQSDRLKPAFEEITLNGEGAPVAIKLYAGLGGSSPKDGGWYVFCNGRLVLGADQTTVTGWGADEGKTIPRYHNQFARFRGYTFFDCDDASRLPWTTTKTSVDANSDVYRQARSRMIILMRPVIDFLNLLDREKDRPPSDEELLEDLVSATQPTRVSAVSTTPKFVSPPREKIKLPETQSIQYRVEKARADRVKKTLRVTTLGDVGRRTFDYYYKLECQDDD
jgi:hypothetical protein